MHVVIQVRSLEGIIILFPSASTWTIHHTLLIPSQTWLFTPSFFSHPHGQCSSCSSYQQWKGSNGGCMSHICDVSLVMLVGVTKPKDWVPNGILLFQGHELHHPLQPTCVIQGNTQKRGCWLSIAHLLCQENNCSTLVQHSGITKHLLSTYCVHSMHSLDASSHLIPTAPFVRYVERFLFYSWGNLGSDR